MEAVQTLRPKRKMFEEQEGMRHGGFMTMLERPPEILDLMRVGVKAAAGRTSLH